MAATAKQVSAILAPNEFWAALRPHLPSFSVEEQRAAVALYRELARGKPVDDAQLASTLGLSIVETRALLEREPIKSLVYADDQGRVLGFGGLGTTSMHHRFEVDGRALSTHGAPVTVCLSPKSWDVRRACHRLIRKSAKLYALS